MGFILRYKGLQNALIVNPGQVIRVTILAVLLNYFIKSNHFIGDNFKAHLYFTIGFFVFFSLYLLVSFGITTNLLDDISNIGKILLFILLIQIISTQGSLFKSYLPHIMNMNFVVFSSNLAFSFFFGIGIANYAKDVDSAFRGFFYAGNVVSLLNIVFIIYFMYFFKFSLVHIITISICFLNTYIIASKTALFIPFLLFIVIFYRFMRKENVYRNVSLNLYNKKYLYLGLLFVIITILLFLIVTFSPQIIKVGYSRFGQTIERSYSAYTRKGGILGKPIFAPLEMFTYRRIEAAKEQVIYMFGNPEVFYIW